MENTVLFRVRYSETDQMGTFYNSRALEWFECGRTELLRTMGLPYAEMERRGVFLPVVEAHVEYRGRARYDDLLKMTSRGSLVGKARLQVDVEIVQAEGGVPVTRAIPWAMNPAPCSCRASTCRIVRLRDSASYIGKFAPPGIPLTTRIP